jgi:hypothetical protein
MNVQEVETIDTSSENSRGVILRSCRYIYQWKEEVAALTNQVQPLPQVVTELNYSLDECATGKVAVAAKTFLLAGAAFLRRPGPARATGIYTFVGAVYGAA